jgi:hypothetical protein
MIVCELEPQFSHPDPDQPEFAFGEVDVFAHNPAANRGSMGSGSYRLSIRRNLSLGRWELYRHYHGNGSEVIEETGTLAEVCGAANLAWAGAWGHALQPGEKGSHDSACDHTAGSPNCAHRCPTAYPRR